MVLEVKNCPKKVQNLLKTWFENDLKKHMILKQVFNQFWTAFWLQFEIGLPLDPSQEHAMTGPDFVINSHMSPMRFLKDVLIKITIFASKKTTQLRSKIHKTTICTLYRDRATVIRFSFYPKHLQDWQEASKRSPRCLQAVSKMVLAVLCKTPK